MPAVIRAISLAEIVSVDLRNFRQARPLAATSCIFSVRRLKTADKPTGSPARSPSNDRCLVYVGQLPIDIGRTAVLSHLPHSLSLTGEFVPRSDDCFGFIGDDSVFHILRLTHKVVAVAVRRTKDSSVRARFIRYAPSSMIDSIRV